MYLPIMFEHVALKFVRLLVDFFFIVFFSILLKIALLMWELLFLNPPSSPSSDPKKEVIDGHYFLSTKLTF